jgi:hypothetical protein
LTIHNVSKQGDVNMITLPQQPRWRICLVVLLLGAWLFGARQPVHAAVMAQSADDVIYSADDQFTATLDQPFALRLEQTAEIEGEDLLIELLYLDESSGCVDADCQEIELAAALYSKYGDMQVSTSISTVFAPDEPYIVELDGYDILLLNLEKAEDGSLLLIIQATRRDGAAANAEGEAAQTATADAAGANLVPSYGGPCAGLSPFDAAAVLQEPINDGEPIANLIFGAVTPTPRKPKRMRSMERNPTCSPTCPMPTLWRLTISPLTKSHYPMARCKPAGMISSPWSKC